MNFKIKTVHFAVVILLSSCHSALKTTTDTGNGNLYNQVIAHRGAWKKNGLPENSVASLREAIRLQCAGSEFDVRMTADDSLVINHDPHYNNLEIEKTNYTDLARFSLSNGEKLPTLREYILAGLKDNSRTKLICEIKPSGISKERARAIAAKTAHLFSELKAVRQVIYISFDYDILKQVLSTDPGANTQYLNGDKSPEQLKADGIKGADYHYSVFKSKPEWIASAKKNRIDLNAWTVNDAADMDWLLANGFDAITTNEPELLFEQARKSPAANGWALHWSDEFNYTGLPDETKWKFETGGHGWGNHELQYYTDRDTGNAFVKDGLLRITALKKQFDKNGCTSAKLITRGKKLFQYGRIEVRAKLPAGRGTWPAIWMLGDNIDKADWPACGEIDIMEHVGFKKDSIFGSIHTKAYNHVAGTQTTKGMFIRDPYTSFHTYSVEWTPEKISFFFDDQHYLDFSNQHKTTDEWPFDAPFYLILNLAVGGDWGGQQGVDDSIFPATLFVDYVRVYQKR